MPEELRNRGWYVTIINPRKQGYTRIKIGRILRKCGLCKYWCMSFGKNTINGVKYMYVYVHFHLTMTESEVTDIFTGGIVRPAYGNITDCSDFVMNRDKYIIAPYMKNYRISRYEKGEI